MRHFIKDPYTLIDEIWKDKDVKIVEGEYKLAKHKFCLIDISLTPAGQDQDRLYIQSPFYRANIRRGNTIIEIINRNRTQCFWARKGTPKILDIKLQYIRYLRYNNPLQKLERVPAQLIFEGVNHAFKEGKRVQLIKTEKANGQNAQISYNYELNAWVICSKNVSIVAATPQDLKMYNQNRHKFATLIAEQWFSEIQYLKGQEIQSLKGLLDGYTLVGQYCGNPEYQHLVKYDEVSLKWFAMVNNKTDEYCEDPFKMKKQLEKFKLKTVKIKNITITSDPKHFYQSLQKLYLKTAQAGLEDEQYGMQGSIVYFAVQQMHDKKTNVVIVGAGKLKTLQYRYFRKIREKMSRYLKRKQIMAETLIKNYLEEIKQLENANQSCTVFPHQYYLQILRTGLKLVDSCELNDEHLRGRFVSILKMIFYSLFKKINVQTHGKKMIRDKDFMEKVSEIPFLKYGGLGCPKKIIYLPLCLPGMFKSYLAKNIAPHFSKIGIPYTIIKFNEEEAIAQNLAILYRQCQKDKTLQHYFIDGSMGIKTISDILLETRKHGDKNSYYKFILIKDQLKQGQEFQTDGYNEYPFRIETILMCYLGQHQKKISCPTIQEKIDNLKIVTKNLQNSSNFHNNLGISIHPFPFSLKCKIENIQEFSEIVKNILNSEEQEEILYQQYCLLIVRLEKMKGIEYQEQEAYCNEIKHLIQSSYPSIPMIWFKNPEKM